MDELEQILIGKTIKAIHRNEMGYLERIEFEEGDSVAAGSFTRRDDMYAHTSYILNYLDTDNYFCIDDNQPYKEGLT